jgi:RNA polymerase sporulation-specific sigma factor
MIEEIIQNNAENAAETNTTGNICLDETAENITINPEEHLGLVRLCANRFRNKGIEYDDLYSTGCIGLMKAANAFESERGLKFSTYAVPVILGEIKRLFRDGGAVKVSRTAKELSLKVTRIRDDCMKETGKEPTISELAKKLNTSEEDIIEALNVSLPTISLTVNDDDENEEIDIRVEAPDTVTLDLISLRQVMTFLDDFEKKLLYLRYFKNLTQVQTAEILDMTQVQVSRKEKKILTFLREKLE